MAEVLADAESLAHGVDEIKLGGPIGDAAGENKGESEDSDNDDGDGEALAPGTGGSTSGSKKKKKKKPKKKVSQCRIGSKKRRS